MGLSSSLSASVSGLEANATRISTISDNIANAGTIGYKKVSTEFGDMVNAGNTNNLYSAGGVETYIERDIAKSGLLQNTSNKLDIAMKGPGFFPVSSIADPTQFTGGSSVVTFSTTGSFKKDDEGYLANSQGQYLLGWPLDAAGKTIPLNASTTTTGDLEPVNVDIIQYTVQPTTAVALEGNLSADNTLAPVPPPALPPTTGTAIPHNVPYYDQIGRQHNLIMIFTPDIGTDTNAASEPITRWTVTIQDDAYGTTAPIHQVGTFTLEFDDRGFIDTVDDGALASTFNKTTGEFPITTFDGSAINIHVGIPGAETNTITQFSPKVIGTGGLQSTADGAALSKLSDQSIDEKGIVWAVYENQQKRAIYQIPVATLKNPDGMETLSGQTYSISNKSGGFLLSTAGTNSAGTIKGNALEQSNVEVAQELTDLIVTQRAYSSNAKVVQTVDEMLQETTNLKR
jgi:flagellar hook protein FlgE